MDEKDRIFSTSSCAFSSKASIKVMSSVDVLVGDELAND